MPSLTIAVYHEKSSGYYALIVDGKHFGSFDDVETLKNVIDDSVSAYVRQQELRF